ncbi:unnamed protein product [Nezara viridula]|uniref:Uncharacterized protein n=1 Tax=Nezara viridula TaxID=85310 RepID=A0A9P0H8E0_NEZVI|nr:unnamed protein product [Nezara viridula]
MCRGCPPIILGGLTLSYPRSVRGLPPRLQSPGCVGVVPLSFLAVLPYPILAASGDCLLGCRALDRQGIASSVAEPWMCRGCPPIILGGLTLSYPRSVRGLPPRLQSPGCVGVVPLSFLAVLPYPILAASGDCLLGCRALDVKGLSPYHSWRSYPILATSGDCLLGCRALDV